MHTGRLSEKRRAQLHLFDDVVWRFLSTNKNWQIKCNDKQSRLIHNNTKIAKSIIYIWLIEESWLQKLRDTAHNAMILVKQKRNLARGEMKIRFYDHDSWRWWYIYIWWWWSASTFLFLFDLLVTWMITTQARRFYALLLTLNLNRNHIFVRVTLFWHNRDGLTQIDSL